MSKLETYGKLDSQMPGEHSKTLGQNAGAIFSARKNLLRDANVACRFRDVKNTGSFPSALTIDASVFTDQSKPTVKSEYERRGTLKASILVEERREDIAEEQQVEDRREDENKDDGKKTSRAAGDVCVSETCGEEKIKRHKTFIDASANEELLARIEEINPTKLSEMINKEINNSIKEINNSIKDAVQTIVKQCSMEEKKSTESERKSRACQFRVADEYCKKSPDLSCRDRRNATCPAMRQYNNPTRDSSFSRAKTTREDATPLPVNINNEKRNKKHSKPASNVSTDNRRMTGNVNIYICSEANDNSADKSRGKTKTQSCTETSTDTITEQSNSRCASSASTCKLINCIQEKRRKLQAQRLSNTLHKRRDKSSDSSEDNVVCDTNNTTVHSICRKVSSEFNKEGVDVKLSDEDVERGDTISSTRNGCCCEDTNSTTGPLCDSSESVVPCAGSFSIFDNSIRPQSWTSIYPSKAEAESNGSDITLDYDENDTRNKICGNDDEYSVCDAIDGNRWQRKSIYTDCATYGKKVPKECFADNCRYRNKKVQDSAVNGNDIWKRRVGYKLRQPIEDCRREHVTLQRSACSCIAEEEEDRCASVDIVGNELPESVCEEATCPEKIYVCRAPSRELTGDATVCGTSFSAVGKCSEETCKSASKDPAECRNGATVYVTTFKNSEEPLKVTRVCKELVAEESSKDIAVCRTVMFGEPKGPPERVAVSKALPDSEEAPKETICKKIPDSNFADQDDVKTVFLNSAEDKLAEGNTNSSNLNNWQENVGNTDRGKQLNKFGNRDNFAGRKSNVNIKQGERTKKLISNDETNTPVKPIEDTTSLPRSIYSAIPRNSINLISNSKASKHISNTHPDQQGSLKFQLPNRPLRNYSQQPSRIAKRSTMRELAASRKNNQTVKKAQDKLKGNEEKYNIPREVKTKEEQPREPLLYRSIKKLADILKYTREQLKAKREAEKTKLKKKIVNDKRDDGEYKTISETEDKIIDEKRQKIVEQIEAPKSPLADGETREKTEAPESIADFRIFKEDKKTDVLKINETTRLKPKLIRIIATKRSRVPTVAATDFKPREPEIESVRVVTDSQEPEVEFPAVETTTIDRVDQEETFQEETIIQEPISEEIQEDTKVEESKISIAEIKVSTKDVADEEKVLKDVIDKKTQVCALFPDEKQREDLQKFISCKCDVLPESNGSYLIAKRAKLYVPCPQKKTKDEAKKTIPCTSPLSFRPKGCFCLLYKSTQCHNIPNECLCEDNERIDHCAPSQYLKSCLKTSQKSDKPKFCVVSPLKINPHICSNCNKTKKECVCKKTAFSRQLSEECKCRRCATRADYSRTADKRRDQCNCVFTECNKITKVCDCRKAMICLYCDNPRDKCTCRAPIGKCSSCGLPSDVCNCQVDTDRDRKDKVQINERSDENRTIRVTSWKPRKEIRRYFTRNSENFQSNPTEECRCYEKPNGQHIPEEQLPYQRLNIFSDVMNELQQKISESICCSRCWKNPCCCELRASQNEETGETRSKDHVRCLEMEKSPRIGLRNKSPNNCRCNSSPKTKRKINFEESISIRRANNCVCEVSPCGCRKNRPNNKRPLAKCYYCKSLPCACIIAR
ncbi:uncharacterized protein LOC109856513 [Pseudomyrmex gracilis]|uniref:uncharacterized protein LOC109856513 n=1 Tax=Pseudomyrmex gracilis TaxID=219809 RepID=UPI000994E7B9|nr:uncharacterized protein LOC109856513 [Pseudomyrmex gracilis]